MQSAIQDHVSSAVSKTINFPNTATKKDIADAFVFSYTLRNIKGLTVYRDGCKANQVLSTTKSDPIIKIPDAPYTLPEPTSIDGKTLRGMTPFGTLHLTINSLDDGRPYECFLVIGKAGRDVGSIAEAIGRLITLCFKYGVPVDTIWKQLAEIGGETIEGIGNKKIKSLPDGVSRTLRRFAMADSEENVQVAMDQLIKLNGNICPVCGNASLVMQQGCQHCISEGCTYEKCG